MTDDPVRRIAEGAALGCIEQLDIAGLLPVIPVGDWQRILGDIIERAIRRALDEYESQRIVQIRIHEREG